MSAFCGIMECMLPFLDARIVPSASFSLARRLGGRPFQVVQGEQRQLASSRVGTNITERLPAPSGSLSLLRASRLQLAWLLSYAHFPPLWSGRAFFSGCLQLRHALTALATRKQEQTHTHTHACTTHTHIHTTQPHAVQRSAAPLNPHTYFAIRYSHSQSITHRHTYTQSVTHAPHTRTPSHTRPLAAIRSVLEKPKPPPLRQFPLLLLHCPLHPPRPFAPLLALCLVCLVLLAATFFVSSRLASGRDSSGYSIAAQHQDTLACVHLSRLSSPPPPLSVPHFRPPAHPFLCVSSQSAPPDLAPSPRSVCVALHCVAWRLVPFTCLGRRALFPWATSASTFHSLAPAQLHLDTNLIHCKHIQLRSPLLDQLRWTLSLIPLGATWSSFPQVLRLIELLSNAPSILS